MILNFITTSYTGISTLTYSLRDYEHLSSFMVFSIARIVCQLIKLCRIRRDGDKFIPILFTTLYTTSFAYTTNLL